MSFEDATLATSSTTFGKATPRISAVTFLIGAANSPFQTRPSKPLETSSVHAKQVPKFPSNTTWHWSVNSKQHFSTAAMRRKVSPHMSKSVWRTLPVNETVRG